MMASSTAHSSRYDVRTEVDQAHADNDALTERLSQLRPALQSLALELATAKRDLAALRAERDRLIAGPHRRNST
jgi:hypothetical protein